MGWASDVGTAVALRPHASPSALYRRGGPASRTFAAWSAVSRRFAQPRPREAARIRQPDAVREYRDGFRIPVL